MTAGLLCTLLALFALAFALVEYRFYRVEQLLRELAEEEGRQTMDLQTVKDKVQGLRDIAVAGLSGIADIAQRTSARLDEIAAAIRANVGDSAALQKIADLADMAKDEIQGAADMTRKELQASFDRNADVDPTPET